MGTHYDGDDDEVRALDAFIKLQRAADSCNAQLAPHLAAEDLTVSQFGTLEVLLHRGPLCQRAIADKLLKSGGNITTVVDNLERRGLVERRRSAEDRRFIHVHLTKDGRALIERIFPVHVARIVALLGALPPEEQALLGALCKRLGTAARDGEDQG